MEKYCDYCANELLKNNRCPDAECVHNLLLDIYTDIEELKAKEAEKEGQDVADDVTVEKGA